MGVNMEIKVVYGVKYDSIGDDLADKIYDDKNARLTHYADCYSGEWDIVGIELESSQDNRYDNQDFSWNLSKYDNFKTIAKEELEKIGLGGEPKILCFTYYM